MNIVVRAEQMLGAPIFAEVSVGVLKNGARA
jgi:hypothetical protein